MKGVTRREFMIKGARLTGGAVGALTIGNGLLSPGSGQAAMVEFPEPGCGVSKDDAPRILVAYASRCGSTGGVAEAIGNALCDCGAIADVRLAKNVGALTPYDAAVIGSAVRSSKCLPEAERFVEENRNALSSVPVAYFLTCLTMARPGHESRRKTRAFLDPLLKTIPEVRPVDIGLFAGVLDYSKLSVMVRMVMKYKMRDKGIQEGDYRNWNEIRTWAKGLHPKLALGASPLPRS